MSTDNATKTDLLSLQDRLNKLDAMADDPWKYKAVEWDEAYADAQYEARACKGMAMGAQAHDIAERFKRAGKRFHACAAFDLVPRATLEHAQEQLRAVGAMNIKLGNISAELRQRVYFPVTIDDVSNAWRRCESVPHGEMPSANQIAKRLNEVLAARAGLSEAPSIGPGDPLPPPPPPTLTAEDIQLAWDECQATKCVMLGYKMAVQLAEACNDVLLMKARGESNKLHELA